jgi:hypothetical protein
MFPRSLPMPRRYYFLLPWVVLHFAFVGLVCLHETLWLLEQRLTIVGDTFTAGWRALDKLPNAILGPDAGARNPWRVAIATYSNATGIEVGYGYFAPNVPTTHALVFECHYPDGRVDYQTPTVADEEARLRLTSLIEEIARTDFAPWREELMKCLARSTWQRHPDAIAIRAFLGSVTPPTAAQYRAGRRERTFDCLYVYDLRRGESKALPYPP